MSWPERLKSFARTWLFEHARPEVWLYIQHLARGGTACYFPASHRTACFAKVARKRLLVLAPHPDDEVIGLGGTLLMHLASKSEVLVLYMTTGGKADGSVSSQHLQGVRRSEAETVASAYGFEPLFWEYEDQGLVNHPETVRELKSLLKEWQPNEIYLPSVIDAHIDHFATNLILAGALGQRTPGNMTIFGYEVATDLSFPNYVMDISPYFNRKRELLALYTSQIKLINYHRLIELRNALNYARYVETSSEGYAECFFYFPAGAFVSLIKSLTDLLPTNPALRAFGRS